MTRAFMNLLAKAATFVEWWNGRSDELVVAVVDPTVLDELAKAIEAYDAALREHELSLPARGDRVFVREATDDEQREALERGVTPAHVELLVHQVLPNRGLHGVLILRNDSTVELDVVRRDGRTIGFPPSGVGDLAPGDTVRTRPGHYWKRPRPVSDRELVWAQRYAAQQQGADYLWAQRLPDGRGVFLMSWNGSGVQLSVGKFGELTFDGSWYYDAANVDTGWREALGWQPGQREPGWCGVRR